MTVLPSLLTLRVRGGLGKPSRTLRVNRLISSRGSFFCRGHACFAPWGRCGHPCFGAAERRLAQRALLPAQQENLAEFAEFC